MVSVGRAFVDPLGEHLFFLRAELEMGLGRRHQVIFILCIDEVDELGILGVARDKGILVDGCFPHVETQLGFPCRLVRAVTGEAVLRENRPDVAIEADPVLSGECEGREGSEEDGGKGQIG